MRSLLHRPDGRAALALAAFLAAATSELCEAVVNVHESRMLQQANTRIHEIEGEADAEYQSGISSLFEGFPDALAVLKWKEVYDRVETLIDMVHRTGKLLDRIAVKSQG